ncbi:hypothetical protein IWX47DRAFT_319000 [Phyllosticta citricarpa]
MIDDSAMPPSAAPHAAPNEMHAAPLAAQPRSPCASPRIVHIFSVSCFFFFFFSRESKVYIDELFLSICYSLSTLCATTWCLVAHATRRTMSKAWFVGSHSSPEPLVRRHECLRLSEHGGGEKKRVQSGHDCIQARQRRGNSPCRPSPAHPPPRPRTLTLPDRYQYSPPAGEMRHYQNEILMKKKKKKERKKERISPGRNW